VIVPIAGSAESLVAYDIVRGKIIWRAALGDIHASPLLLLGRVFVGNATGRFSAVDRSTGEELWHFDLPGNSTLKGIRSSAAGVAPSIVFGADDGTVYALDAITGRLKWKFNAIGAIQAAPSIADSTVFAGTLLGNMYALRLSDGTLLWSDSAEGAIYAPPLIHSGHCVFGTTAGIVAANDMATGARIWTCDVRSPVSAGLLGTKSMLYAGTLRKELIAIDPREGAVVWRDTVSARIKTVLIAGGNSLFVATDDRLIQAFGEDRK
jgi:outer membrane protein assembly factor BamB